MLDYMIIVLMISFIMSVAGTFGSIKIAQKLNMMDQPGEIKIHCQPAPRLGGIGIFLGILISFSFVRIIGNANSYVFSAVIAGGFLTAATGFFDDILNLKPWQKLLGQAMGGLGFLLLFLPFTPIQGSFYILLIFLISFVVIISMGNSFNLFDGMDGLVAGTSSVVGIMFLILALAGGYSGIALLSVSLIGAVLGFLVFNRPPARTFMGDTGSLLLGYMVAVIALMLLLQDFSISRTLGLLLIIALPITDTFLAIVRRFVNKKRIFEGDRFHLYDCVQQRLSKRSTWLTITIMWFVELVYGIIGLYVYYEITANAFIMTCISLLVLLLGAYKIGSVRGVSRVSSTYSTGHDQTVSH